MGRSVNRLNHSLYTSYLQYDEPSEEGDEDHSQSGTYEWEEFENFICDTIQSKYNSFSKVENKWDNNETKIILENDHAIIGISEYGNIVSISIAINQQDHTSEQLSEHWINQIWPNLDQLMKVTFPMCYLTRLGGLSDGTSVYKR